LSPNNDGPGQQSRSNDGPGQQSRSNDGPGQQSRSNDGFLDLPELPSVPTDSFPPPDESLRPGNPENDDIDFDDLTRRFEDLKKKK